ncbi:unnamed protein product [Mesocestoides corti]|uniref:Uncharacterized protein n=1 Tax=Mesocestoides corti TaxID=53468 RepID=A0A0R3UE57_MESCO|nr:unnamed protein product [Mesocestoides corti]
MIATVDIVVQAPDMFSASRQAQRLAGNFLDDVDDFQRASRAADRRAMSHFEEASSSTYYSRPRHSISISRFSTSPSDIYIDGARLRLTSAEPRYTTYQSSLHPVTIIGSRYHRYTPSYYRYYPRYYTYGSSYPYTSYYDYPTYSTYSYRYWPYTSGAHYSHYMPSTTYYTTNSRTLHDYSLPTSGLKASVPSWDIGYRPLSLSRWYSHSDLVEPLVVFPAAPPPSYSRPRARWARHRSVPPVSLAAAAQYRRAGSVARMLPPPPPPIKYVSTEYYSDLTGPEPINTKYVYHYTSPPLSRSLYRPYYYRHLNGPRSNFENAVSQEVMAERRRIDRKMDDLLSYKLPDPSIYNDLKASLRKVHDKMDVHRTLLDRYSAIDMQNSSSTVEDRIASKCRELGERMGR